MVYYFLPKGLKKLKKELKRLKTVELAKVQEDIKDIVSSGILKENTALLDKRKILLIRISELEKELRNAKIVTKKQTHKVSIGSTVLISLNGKEEKFNIVGKGLINPSKRNISYESPLGNALIGKSIGDSFEVDIEGEKVFGKILKIE